MHFVPARVRDHDNSDSKQPLEKTRISSHVLLGNGVGSLLTTTWLGAGGTRSTVSSFKDVGPSRDGSIHRLVVFGRAIVQVMAMTQDEKYNVAGMSFVV
jgi:hypothetical protein